MPAGLRNAPAVFQSLMDLVLRGIQFKYVMVYIDDICIYSRTFVEHLDHLTEVFSQIRKAKLKLHPKKCKFAVQEVHYLGHAYPLRASNQIPTRLKQYNLILHQQRSKHLGLSGYDRLLPNLSRDSASLPDRCMTSLKRIGIH